VATTTQITKEVLTEEEEEPIEVGMMKAIGIKDTLLSKCAMVSLKTRSSKSHLLLLKLNLKLRSRNRVLLHMCKDLIWCLLDPDGAMHSRLFLRNLPKKRSLRRLKSLLRLLKKVKLSRKLRQQRLLRMKA
jgi:hypothetical protein